MINNDNYLGSVSRQKITIEQMMTRTEMIATYLAAILLSGCSNNNQICLSRERDKKFIRKTKNWLVLLVWLV